MYNEINAFFNNIPRILLEELKKNSLPINRMDNEIFAGIIYLSSIIYNKQLTGSVNLNLPEISKESMHDLIKNLLNYIDPNVINNLFIQCILSSEFNYDPINTIASYDQEHTIRVVNLSDNLLEQIWNSLSPAAQENQKMKRYFKYKLDNPSLEILFQLFNGRTDFIDYIKGHGMSSIVKIPKIIDKNLSFILGAIRDGGIHYDRTNDAYKIHFEQKNRNYLEEEIQPRLESLFHLNTEITPRPDGVHQIQFSSKPIYLLLSKCFGMREIQQFWKTPILIERAPLDLKKEYIKGFFEAEGSFEHIYHSWFNENECPPLEFISNVLNNELGIRCSEPSEIQTDNKFNRFPAYQIFINDYHNFLREIRNF